MSAVRTPGELLGSAATYRAGEGAYEQNGVIRASAVGIERVLPPPKNQVRLPYNHPSQAPPWGPKGGLMGP